MTREVERWSNAKETPWAKPSWWWGSTDTPWSKSDAWWSSADSPWAKPGAWWNSTETPWAAKPDAWRSTGETPWAAKPGAWWGSETPWAAKPGSWWGSETPWASKPGAWWGSETPWAAKPGAWWDSAEAPWAAQAKQGTWWNPRVDLKETEKEFTLTADLPGFDKKEIFVSVDNNCLTLKGQRKTEEKNTNETWHHSERSWGSFERSFTLPTNLVDKDKVTAKFENGVLTVWLTKWPEAQKEMRKVEVK